MILRGVLDRALKGNFTCLRGFASLEDLNRISEPDPSYQRDLINTHRQMVINFFNDEKYLFFPEVILGTALDDSFKPGATNSFYEEFYSHKSSSHTFSDFKINYSVTVAKSKSDKRVTNLFRRTRMTIHESVMETGLFKKFHRIDGNHRLSVLDAFRDLDEDLKDKFKGYNVPFCIVLFEDAEKLKTHSRVLFHNLNYKQIPLTMEKNLELILDDGSPFDDDELKNDFGVEYLLSRKVLKSWDLEMIPNIQNVLTNKDGENVCTRTFLLHTAKQLGEKCSVRKFKQHLGAINAIYDDDKLQKNINHGLLAAFMYYAHLPEPKLKMFTSWVLANHIYETEDIDVKELIKVFDRIGEARRKTIFVSMQFGDETKANYIAIKSAVTDVNREHKLELAIREIRIDQFRKGYSYKIDDEILELIEGCGLLIADLTMGNKNVYHEIGYLMGMNKGRDQSQDNFIFLHNESASKKANFGDDVGFNLKPHQVIKVDDTNTLRAELKEQIEIYYQLRQPSQQAEA